MKSLYINKKSVKTLSVIAAASIGLMLCAASSKASITLYNFSVPTDALNANPSGAPYSLFFQLTDGSGTNDGNNTATISNFNVAGPASPIVITDNTPFPSDTESFTPNTSPGSLLTFTLSITNNADAGPTPDEFSFFILDGTSSPITTTDTLGGASAVIDLVGGSSPSVITFNGTGTYAGVDPSVSTPEPSSVVALTTAFLAVGALVFMRRRSSSQSA